MPSVWIFQDARMLKEHGPEKASWYVGWIDPDGKQRCKSVRKSGERGRKAAEKLQTIRERELETGTYQRDARKKWDDFRGEHDKRILAGMEAPSRRVVTDALEHFQRLAKPKKMATIRTQTIDDFIARRRLERGKCKGDLVSPATVNKELRHLKAALRIAHEWGYLPVIPKFRMLKEPGKLATYITPEHFAAIYAACDKAKLPRELPYPAADWWRGLIVMGYMTGWRISELLAVRRADVDLDAGTALTRHQDNKGNRDDRVKLHPVVVEHLKKLPGFDPCVFPWNTHERQLYDEFGKIQDAAGIKLPCVKEHEHTDACHWYGFHDLRRAFATVNADKMTADALQKLMRHKSYSTTQRYINMARQLDEAVGVLYVPEVLKNKAQGG